MNQLLLIIISVVILLLGIVLIVGVEKPPQAMQNWALEQKIKDHKNISLGVGIALLVLALALFSTAFMKVKKLKL